jgi:restriction endonuclease S subunit
MKNFSIIKKSQLEGAMRIDAEYYQPEFLQVKKLVERFNHVNFGDIMDVLTDYHANGSYETLNENVRILDEQNFALMIRTTDLENDNFDGNVRYVSEKAYEFLKKTKVFGGEIIINKIGSAGSVYLMPKLNREVSLGMNQFMIRLKNGINTNYVYAFLISKYGKKLIAQLVTGAVPQSIDKDSVRSIKIPIFSNNFQEGVDKLILESNIFKNNSFDYYKQAELLLLKELELEGFDNIEKLSSIVNLSDVEFVHRIDAEYFQPKYAIIEEKIKKYNHKNLEDVIQNVPAKFDPRKDSNANFKYVELSNINSSAGTIEGFSNILGADAPGRAKRILKKEDVIVSSVEGSIEKVALVDGRQDGYLASTGFFQFRSKEILPEVLLAIAKSIIFKMQLEKQCAGTILTAVPKEAIKNIIVPILPKEAQQKIAELVRQSHEARKKSKELLEEAKRKIEEMIEKGGDG